MTTGTKPPDLPDGTCDSAVHVYRGAVASRLNATRSYEPPPASLEDLQAMHGGAGIARGVMVQPTTYGADNRQMFEAMAGATPAGRYRGIMLIDEATTDGDLAAAHEAGVRGVRFNIWHFLGQPFDRALFDRTVERIAPLGWHVRLHLKGDELLEHEELIRTCPVPVTIDHMAHMEIADGLDQAPMVLLLDLLRAGHVWVMISNYDRWSPAGPPDYADALPFIRALLDANPDRCIWGTDWPHIVYKGPDNRTDILPDPRDLLRTFLSAANDDRLAERVLAENPARLFGWD